MLIQNHIDIDPVPSHLPFTYTIMRAKRKTLGLYIRNGHVEVRTPHFIKNEDIHQWVTEKTPWILDRLAEHQQQEKEKPDITHEGQLLFLGEYRQLIFKHGKTGIEEHHNQLYIYHPTHSNIQPVLEKWLKKEAELYIHERLLEIANTMGDSKKITGIQFRKTKSKWGHCSSSGVLQFNWLIIMAPPDVIDYLIIHELSHLTHMNHSALFWQRVSQFCPHYKTHRNWLKNNGHKLWM